MVVGELPSSTDQNGVIPTGIMVNELFGNDGNDYVQPSQPMSVKVVLPESEESDMQLFARTHRHSLLVEDKQDLMIGCAWTTPPEKRLVKMFGEVLHIDCTANTNNEDRPFLTITGRNSNGKIFTVMHSFLPKERAWVICWLFQTAMPALLSRDFIGRVKVIVTDGDSQVTSQLNTVIAFYFNHVCRVQCCWHVVDRGWICYCPGVRCISRENQAAFNLIISQIKAWLVYSWKHSSCESEEEHRILNALLDAYLHSPSFVSIATEPVAGRTKCSSAKKWSRSSQSSQRLKTAVCNNPFKGRITPVASTVRHFCFWSTNLAKAKAKLCLLYSSFAFVQESLQKQKQNCCSTGQLECRTVVSSTVQQFCFCTRIFAEAKRGITITPFKFSIFIGEISKLLYKNPCKSKRGNFNNTV